MPTDRYDAPSAMAWSSQSAPTMQRFLLSSRQSVWTAPAMNSVCTGSGTYFTRRRNASRMTCILSRAPVGLPPSTRCRRAHARVVARGPHALGDFVEAHHGARCPAWVGPHDDLLCNGGALERHGSGEKEVRAACSSDEQRPHDGGGDT